jgi:hypothetical protein
VAIGVEASAIAALAMAVSVAKLSFLRNAQGVAAVDWATIHGLLFYSRIEQKYLSIDYRLHRSFTAHSTR